MRDNLFGTILKNLWPYCIILCIVIVSFAYYAPCFSFDYNSDQAIQSLMSMSFSFKRDFFYWGQNRLGSFLPMITYPFFKLTHVHPLYLISIIHYALLVASGLMISSFARNNNWIKVAVFTAIFFPFSDYIAITFIGHPYSVQLFCGSLFLFTLSKIYKTVLLSIDQGFHKKYLRLLIPLGLINALAFWIGFWTSELSIILILIPGFSLLLDIKHLKKLVNSSAFRIVLALFTIVSAAFLFEFYSIKMQLPADTLYDHPFFFDADKIAMQFGFLKQRIIDLIFFKDTWFLTNLFYYIITFLFILFFIIKRDNIKNITFALFYKSSLFTFLFAYVMLFFSNWNLRSEFCPRYYTPLYYLFILSFFIAIDKKFTFKKTSVFGLIFILFSSYYTYNAFHGKNIKGAFTKCKKYDKLPKGTLVAGYWDAYFICSVAYKNLTPLIFENQMNRSPFMVEKALENKNFYFINNKEFKQCGFKDTIKQYYQIFVFTGEIYDCNGHEVLNYRKL